jgi:hypothetical protein
MRHRRLGPPYESSPHEIPPGSQKTWLKDVRSGAQRLFGTPGAGPLSCRESLEAAAAPCITPFVPPVSRRLQFVNPGSQTLPLRTMRS